MKDDMKDNKKFQLITNNEDGEKGNKDIDTHIKSLLSSGSAPEDVSIVLGIPIEEILPLCANTKTRADLSALDDPEKLLKAHIDTTLELIKLAKTECESMYSDKNVNAYTDLVRTLQGLYADLSQYQSQTEKFEEVRDTVLKPIFSDAPRALSKEIMGMKDNLSKYITDDRKFDEELKKAFKNFGLVLNDVYNKYAGKLYTIFNCQDTNNLPDLPELEEEGESEDF